MHMYMLESAQHFEAVNHMHACILTNMYTEAGTFSLEFDNNNLSLTTVMAHFHDACTSQFICITVLPFWKP